MHKNCLYMYIDVHVDVRVHATFVMFKPSINRTYSTVLMTLYRSWACSNSPGSQLYSISLGPHSWTCSNRGLNLAPMHIASDGRRHCPHWSASLSWPSSHERHGLPPPALEDAQIHSFFEARGLPYMVIINDRWCWDACLSLKRESFRMTIISAFYFDRDLEVTCESIRVTFFEWLVLVMGLFVSRMLIRE